MVLLVIIHAQQVISLQQCISKFQVIISDILFPFVVVIGLLAMAGWNYDQFTKVSPWQGDMKTDENFTFKCRHFYHFCIFSIILLSTSYWVQKSFEEVFSKEECNDSVSHHFLYGDLLPIVMGDVFYDHMINRLHLYIVRKLSLLSYTFLPGGITTNIPCHFMKYSSRKPSHLIPYMLCHCLLVCGMGSP